MWHYLCPLGIFLSARVDLIRVIAFNIEQSLQTADQTFGRAESKSCPPTKKPPKLPSIEIEKPGNVAKGVHCETGEDWSNGVDPRLIPIPSFGIDNCVRVTNHYLVPPSNSRCLENHTPQVFIGLQHMLDTVKNAHNRTGLRRNERSTMARSIYLGMT